MLPVCYKIALSKIALLALLKFAKLLYTIDIDRLKKTELFSIYGPVVLINYLYHSICGPEQGLERIK